MGTVGSTSRTFPSGSGTSWYQGPGEAAYSWGYYPPYHRWEHTVGATAHHTPGIPYSWGYYPPYHRYTIQLGLLPTIPQVYHTVGATTHHTTAIQYSWGYYPPYHRYTIQLGYCPLPNIPQVYHTVWATTHHTTGIPYSWGYYPPYHRYVIQLGLVIKLNLKKTLQLGFLPFIKQLYYLNTIQLVTPASTHHHTSLQFSWGFLSLIHYTLYTIQYTVV